MEISEKDYLLEKILRQCADKISKHKNIGCSFQLGPLTLFIYDFDKELFHNREVLKLKISCGKISVYKRQPAGWYKSLGQTGNGKKLYSYIKKACNV